MRILALDDSELTLKLLVQSIKMVVPKAEVISFNRPSKLIEFAKMNSCDIVFLDIQMWGMNGLEVAKTLKEIYSKINIIFVTAHTRYLKKMFEFYPSSYVLKPVTKEAVLSEIENSNHPLNSHTEEKILVQTFGNFDIFVNNKPLIFGRSKAKEMLAYLIDRKGACVKTAEIAAILWEDREYDRSLQAQTQVIISELMKTLRENGINDIVIKKRNQIAIDKSKIKCDYYDFLNWDMSAVNGYTGEYMSNYSWAEMTAGELAIRNNR